MSTNEALRNAKRELRTAIAKRLDAVDTPSIQDQSHAVFGLLTSLPEYQRARSVSIYLSMPAAEIDTVPMVRDAFERGKQVYIPFTHKAAQTNPQDEEPTPSKMDMVSLDSLEDYQSLKRNSWGIPTPTKKSLETRQNCIENLKKGADGLDLIVLPGVAFDNDCRRLGHGKGYYDYFLRRYYDQTGGGIPFTIGVALKEQFLGSTSNVPTGDQDWALDMVLVGDSSIVRRK
ncbi:hypothetical protein H072_7184 [Dactylellina haptotyla CBS 200.50]|uniref:5-formyltetrahydrofolate cyclo-ligase n=1 Tax=Dactylellina haptotyla (strain CBS 200.50) TaxID=1284197 RepID=S8A7P8_DACHA|nr:hypothetical protein H072_7184 [Dactylellina haptotyla CBS 200.50]